MNIQINYLFDDKNTCKLCFYSVTTYIFLVNQYIVIRLPYLI